MLLDSWWDPALYEQMHMQMEHKEQDAIRNGFTFAPSRGFHAAWAYLRMINLASSLSLLG